MKKSKTRLLVDLVDELKGLYRPPFGAVATWRKIRQAIQDLGREAGISRIDQISPAAVADWLGAIEGRSRATRRTLLSSLRRACSYAVGRGYLRQSPFAFRPLKDWLGREDLEESLDRSLDDSKRKHKTIEEIAQVLALLEFESADRPERLKLFTLAVLLAYTGARAREALGAKVADFDLPNRVWRIRPNERRRLKTAKSARRVPIPEPAAKVLESWLPLANSVGPWAFPGPRGVGPWTQGAHGYRAIDAIKAAGLRAGVPGLTLLSFRHSFITHASSWGISLDAVRALAGHASLRTTEGYRGYDATDMKAVAERIKIPYKPVA